MSRVHDRVRVLVVGAGLAGLRCAERHPATTRVRPVAGAFCQPPGEGRS
jgi:aspartate oxidase